jgi:MoxR-like ATPase
MQEAQVTIDGVSHALPEPFLVVATQNPVEYEGTYPLPEAQLDRFLMKVVVAYPSAEEEARILSGHVGGMRMTDLEALGVRPVAGPADVLAARAVLDDVVVDEGVIGYVNAIVRATREDPAVSLGASPRAGVSLLVAAKARALLSGREFVTPDDIKDMAPASLRHRLVLQPEAEIEGTGADAVIADVLAGVPVPR